MADTTEQPTTETEPTTTEVPTEEKKEEVVTEEKKEEEVPPTVTEEEQQQEPHEDEAEGVQVEVERRHTIASQTGKKVGVKEGYLHKQGGKFKTWKKRYFVLLETSITYFDKLNGKIKGGILTETITGVRASKPNETKKPFAFTIVCGKGRPYVQVGADSADMEAWMEAILKIVPESQLTPVEEPKTEEDASEEPKKEEDASEEPKEEEEGHEEPKKEEDASEEPKKEEDATEEPKKEEDASEEPKKEEGASEEPKKEEDALGSSGLTIILCRQSAGSWGFEVQRGKRRGSVQVCAISPNSPAQCGGLVMGDDILAIDGIAVEQLVGRVSSVLRGNQTTQVKLQIIPHVNITKRSSLFLSDGDQVALNLVRKNLKAKWGLKFQVNSWTKHLLVVDSAKGSICLKAGVLPGDRVVSINGQQVANGANPIAQANELMAASTNVAMIIERREYWATKVPMQATIVMPLFPQNMAYTVPQQQMGYPQQQQQPPPQYQTMDRNGAPPTEKGQMEHPPQYPQQTEKGQMGNPPQQPQQMGGYPPQQPQQMGYPPQQPQQMGYPPQQQPPNYPPQQQQQQQQPPIYPPQQPTLNNGQNAATANMLANSNDGPIYEDMNETPDINNRAVSNPAYDNTGAYMEVLPPSSSNDDRTSLI